MPWDPARLASAYVDLAPQDELGAPDALSAAGLFARERQQARLRGPRADPEGTAQLRFRHDYYGRLFRSLAQALALPNWREAFDALTAAPWQPLPASALPAGREPAFRHLLALRAQALTFAQLGAGPAPEPAHAWYLAERSRLLAGLSPLDDALCQLLGWESESRVSVARLRAEFELPVLEPAERRLWD